MLDVDKWIVSGRSWGTTLALVYAQAYLQLVSGLFLAVVFLCDDDANKWLFQDGDGNVYSKEWDDFVSLVPVDKLNDIMGAYRDMMSSDDNYLVMEAARRWSTWNRFTA